jgi:molybdopterin-containing oxidoreductase family iron-sulfur binding subunit
MATPTPLDLGALRRHLAGAGRATSWRSLDALARTPEFVAFLEQEFPHLAARAATGPDRRTVLKLMAASLGLMGLGACTRQPAETVVPYVRQPELVPGEPLWFATAMALGGYATGVLVESHEGRPTKVEGNPAHPASLGATDAIAQAWVLGLYDPDRSQVVTNGGAIRPWDAFREAVRGAMAVERARRGAGLRLLTETVTSPTLAGQIGGLLDAFPSARWHQYEPAGRDAVRAGARLAFGEPVETRYRLDRARVVLALDADLFGAGPARLRHARDFARARRASIDRGTHEAGGTAGPAGEMSSRLWVVESMPTVTGAAADHRLPRRAADVEFLARAVAARLGLSLAASPPPRPADRAFVEALVRDLEAHRGAAVIVAGDQQPPSLHALVHAMNHALGNVGRTVEYTAPVEARPVDQLASLRELVADMEAGAVETLVIVGGNPVLTAPADLDLPAALARVGLCVRWGLYEDETSARCHWHVPAAHELESWSDVRAFDGTATIVQPLIAPLYGGRTAHELLAALGDGPERSGHDLVRARWRAAMGGRDGGFARFWQQALHDGVVPDTARAPRRVSLRRSWDAAAPPAPAPDDALELVLRPDPYLVDGRFANNAWLQELPRPVTKLTWDNAALLAPADAERLGVGNEDVVEIRRAERTLEVPVWIVPGHAPGSVTLHLGYGRERGGEIARGVGVDAYVLATAAEPHGGPGLTLRPTGARRPLASTQDHHATEGRDLVRSTTLAALREDGARAHAPRHGAGDASLYPAHPAAGHAWGMAIDLSACIGCHACVAACQAENNIPVVGKTEVRRGREMHWLRLDRYFAGSLDAPAILHQPVPCMHCENAPCEVVCPVNATVHSSEGLNDMVYNRCVGTRYCSNNCPYKVRHFNFFRYADWTTESLKLVRNPDVTVRSRGVMEKCTYCVQRIERARIEAARADRPIRDGDVVTACQQACPTEAIVFGDLNDPGSLVARRKAEARNYALLGELNTRPRTTYLAAVRNPVPGLGTDDGGET